MSSQPSALECDDLTIPSFDGLPLRAWSWRRANPRGVIIIAHGLGEHGGCYGHVAEVLGPALDVDVLALDFRGHGRSPGRRGVVRRYEDLTGDLRAVLAWAGRERPGVPRFLLGHSNGGQVALRAVLDDPGLVADLILSNPCLRLAVQVPAWKRGLGKVLHRVAPGVTLKATATDEQMTRDPESLAARRLDPLRHSRICAPMFFGMVEGGASLLEHAGEIRTPVLMLLGAADCVTDAETSKQFFVRLGSRDKTIVVYPEVLHEPLNDLDRKRVLDEIVGWVAQRLEAPPPLR